MLVLLPVPGIGELRADQRHLKFWRLSGKGERSGLVFLVPHHFEIADHHLLGALESEEDTLGGIGIVLVGLAVVVSSDGAQPGAFGQEARFGEDVFHLPFKIPFRHVEQDLLAAIRKFGNVTEGFSTQMHIVSVFKSRWADSGGPRMEYVLYATVAALLDCENVSLLGIQRMLSDGKYRAWVVAFEDFFRHPSNDGCGVLSAFELRQKLTLKVCDVRHRSFCYC